MQLDKAYADVRIGRPTEAERYLKLQPDPEEV